MNTKTDEPTADLWQRSSVLIGGIWLFFLLFPIIGAWTSDSPLWARLATIACLLAFGAVYLHGYTVGDWERVTWQPSAHLGAMIVLAAASYPVAGLNGPITCSIFIMSYSVFVFPLRVSLAVAAAALAAMVLMTTLSGQWDEWAFLVAIALMVGVATTGARLAGERGEARKEMEREIALAHERERVARDVHDLLGHSLTAITVKAELAEKLLLANPEKARQELRDIQSISREAITEVRHTVGALRARRLDAELEGAAAALSDAGIAVVLPDDVTVVEPRLRVLFAWVVREAATNVLRHSGAAHCWIELGPSSLTIADDGRGTTLPAVGNGLKGLHERVEEAGGTLEILRRDGGGTLVEVRA